MSISMYQASVPIFVRALNNLSAVLEKGAAHARAKGVEPDRLLQQRLMFDMFPLIKQVQIACDTATRSAARLAGVEAKPFADTETTLAQAQDRIKAAVAYLNTFTAAQIDGSEEHAVDMKMGKQAAHFTGLSYITTFALPNFFFHCTTAYDILRVAGAPVGKHDYLGQ
ncbi:MAG TPA: DUF1993 domain-containing protein [Nevskiaceae bacterium]|nr:DUF1993 domain-containing protein [Nevskiaceae bacterium]